MMLANWLVKMGVWVVREPIRPFFIMIMRVHLIGKKFYKLTVLSFSHKNSYNAAYYNCKCECGNETVVRGTNLTNGKTRSCGCLVKASELRLSYPAEYGIWANIKYRCYTPTAERYDEYGARGIRVCDRWLNSFENFMEDMGPRPTQLHSLDRFPNNDTGYYEPGNCRWGTPKEQAGNRRDNRWIEHEGRRMIISDWAREIGIQPGRLIWYLKTKTMVTILVAYKNKKKGHPVKF